MVCSPLRHSVNWREYDSAAQVNTCTENWTVWRKLRRLMCVTLKLAETENQNIYLHLCSCLIISVSQNSLQPTYFLDFAWNFAIFHHVNMKETINLMSWKCLFVHRDILYDIIHPSYPSRFTSFSSIGDKSSSHSWTSSLSRSLTLKHRTFGKTHIKIRRTITWIKGLYSIQRDFTSVTHQNSYRDSHCKRGYGSHMFMQICGSGQILL